MPAELVLLNWYATSSWVTEGICFERPGSFCGQYPEHASLLA